MRQRQAAIMCDGRPGAAVLVGGEKGADRADQGNRGAVWIGERDYYERTEESLAQKPRTLAQLCYNAQRLL